MKTLKLCLIIIVPAITSSSCSSNPEVWRGQTGGALVGGLAGGLIDDSWGGAAVGAALGGLIGGESAKRR